MAALTGSIQSNVQIYFDISDVLSFSENITDLCVHKFHIKVFEVQVHLTTAAIELQDKQIKSESLSVREFRAANSTAFQTI